MDINMEVTAKFTSEDVNTIVREYLEKEGYTVREIKSLTTTVSTGFFGREESRETIFDGIEAQIKVKKI